MRLIVSVTICVVLIATIQVNPAEGDNGFFNGLRDTVSKLNPLIKRESGSTGNENTQKTVVVDPIVTPKPEKGRLSGFGRDVVSVVGQQIGKGIKAAGDLFSKTSSGLDTAPGFLGKITNGITSTTSIAKDAFLKRVNTIYPGTKWCGGGNVSESDDDLGLFADTDACCREHDKCPDNMAAGETKNGLYNKGLFTRSHCKCDIEFFNCLKEAKSPISYSIGVTYFNVIGPQCYKEDFPIKDCASWVVTESNLTKCTKYVLDTESKPVYQWFDSELFVKLPEINTMS